MIPNLSALPLTPQSQLSVSVSLQDLPDAILQKILGDIDTDTGTMKTTICKEATKMSLVKSWDATFWKGIAVKFKLPIRGIEPNANANEWKAYVLKYCRMIRPGKNVRKKQPNVVVALKYAITDKQFEDFEWILKVSADNFEIEPQNWDYICSWTLRFIIYICNQEFTTDIRFKFVQVLWNFAGLSMLKSGLNLREALVAVDAGRVAFDAMSEALIRVIQHQDKKLFIFLVNDILGSMWKLTSEIAGYDIREIRDGGEEEDDIEMLSSGMFLACCLILLYEIDMEMRGTRPPYMGERNVTTDAGKRNSWVPFLKDIVPELETMGERNIKVLIDEGSDFFESQHRSIRDFLFHRALLSISAGYDQNNALQLCWELAYDEEKEKLLQHAALSGSVEHIKWMFVEMLKDPVFPLHYTNVDDFVYDSIPSKYFEIIIPALSRVKEITRPQIINLLANAINQENIGAMRWLHWKFQINSKDLENFSLYDDEDYVAIGENVIPLQPRSEMYELLELWKKATPL